MEVTQGNSLCSYLKQAKMSFLFSLFYKIREQEGETGSAWGRTVIAVGGGGSGERVKEDKYGANTVYT
jgi:hypothetical protein